GPCLRRRQPRIGTDVLEQGAECLLCGDAHRLETPRGRQRAGGEEEAAVFRLEAALVAQVDVAAVVANGADSDAVPLLEVSLDGTLERAAAGVEFAPEIPAGRFQVGEPVAMSDDEVVDFLRRRQRTVRRLALVEMGNQVLRGLAQERALGVDGALESPPGAVVEVLDFA